MSAPTYTREHFLTTYTLIASPLDDTECPICREEYDATTNHAAVTFSDEGSCKHIYGRHCIVSWLSGEKVN